MEIKKKEIVIPAPAIDDNFIHYYFVQKLLAEKIRVPLVESVHHNRNDLIDGVEDEL